MKKWGQLHSLLVEKRSWGTFTATPRHRGGGGGGGGCRPNVFFGRTKICFSSFERNKKGKRKGTTPRGEKIGGSTIRQKSAYIRSFNLLPLRDERKLRRRKRGEPFAIK